MRTFRWAFWTFYIVLGISVPFLCMRWHAPFTKGGWISVFVIGAIVAFAGAFQIYLEITRPKEFELEGVTIKRVGKRDMLILPNSLTAQEQQEASRLCVFIACCNPGSTTETSFATELFPCPQRTAYENRTGSLEISVSGRVMLIPNEPGWQDDNPNKILIHRQFSCSSEDIAAFRRDSAWTQVKQQASMA